MWIRFVTFSVWLALGASVVAWFLPMVRQAPVGAGAGQASLALDGGVPPADWSPLLTRAPAAHEPPPVAADAARFRLVGVAGPLRPTGQGVALVSIDGKPARALRAGDVVEGNRVVMEVTAHTVKIGVPGGPPSLTLQAPLLPPPATGVPPGMAAPSS